MESTIGKGFVMSVLSHQTIRKRRIFTPFYDRTHHEPTGLTYGCGAASYDVRIAESIKLVEGVVTLASAMEHFTMPMDICAVVHDKSSLARAGILVQNTFVDPGWRGFLTLEISYHVLQGVLNQTGKPRELRLIAGTPIAQIVFHYLDQPTERPYQGKYQDQPAGAQPSHMITKQEK
jgi:dCTP deaminase